MKILLSDLEKITEALFVKIKNSGYDEVEISDDYYWNISNENRYTPYKEPEEFTLGQLSDDWNELSKILENSEEPINYALVWLAAILRKIGEDLPG